MNPREAKLATILTGYYTVEELCSLLGRPVLSVAKDLYGLIMGGYAVMKGVRSGKRPQLPGHGQAPPEAESVSQADRPEPAPSSPPPAPPVEEAAPAAAFDPVKMAKLNHFALRIVQTSKTVLPAEHHDMLNRLLAKATHQLIQGEGPEVVKNLALAVSRSAVEAGCEGELVKTLNAQLKALFSK